MCFLLQQKQQFEVTMLETKVTASALSFSHVISSPLLFVQQREQRAPGDVLGHDGKLAGVVQTRSDKVDDAGVVEAAEDGDLPAEHVHV